MYGPRTELNYLLPLKFLWHAQGNSAFADNSFIGLSADVRPVRGVRIPLMIYVDDAGFNDLATFNFDTKYLMATASAVQWAPEAWWNPMVEASYEAVLPYMYTHAGMDPYTTEPNYLTYTHQDTSIGNSLLPNSDRARLTVNAAPRSGLNVVVTGAMIRHANASEDELDQYLNDGGYYDGGRDGEFSIDPTDPANELQWRRGDLVYNETFGFLTQDHVERRYQSGVKSDISIPLSRGSFVLGAGYTFEYVETPIAYISGSECGRSGVTSAGGGRTTTTDNEVNHYTEFTLRYTY